MSTTPENLGTDFIPVAIDNYYTREADDLMAHELRLSEPYAVLARSATRLAFKDIVTPDDTLEILSEFKPGTPAVFDPEHFDALDIPATAIALKRASLPSARFLAKAELGKHPVAAKALGHMGGIFIDRERASLQIKRVSRMVKHAMQEDQRNLVVFGGGTRVQEGEEADQFAGAVFFAKQNGAVVVPIGLAGLHGATKALKPYVDGRLPHFGRRARVAVVAGEPLEPSRNRKADAEELHRRKQKLHQEALDVLEDRRLR